MPNTVRQIISDAEVLLATERTLALVPKSKAERHVISSDLNELVATIEKAADKRVALLIYGDPMFYGLARYVCEKLGKDRFVVVPHVSSMQLAFARVMETWEEAYLTDLAKHPLDSVLEKIRTAQKVGMFTTDQCGPAQVAKSRPRRRRLRCELCVTMAQWLVICTPSSIVTPPLASIRLKWPM